MTTNTTPPEEHQHQWQASIIKRFATLIYEVELQCVFCTKSQSENGVSHDHAATVVKTFNAVIVREEIR